MRLAFRNESMYHRLFSSYSLAFLLITLLFGLILYTTTTRQLHDDVSAVNVGLLKRDIQSIELILNQLSQETLQFAVSPVVDELFSRTLNPPTGVSPEEISLLYRASDLALTVLRTSPMVSAVYVHKYTDDLSITTNTSIGEMDDYDTLLKSLLLEDRSLFSRWLTIHAPLEISAYTEKSVLFARPLPAFSNRSLGAVIVTLDLERMARVLDAGRFSPDSQVFVLNDRGTVLYHDDRTMIGTALTNGLLEEEVMGVQEDGYFTMRLANAGHAVAVAVSDYTGWKYVVATPTRSFLENVNAISRIILFIFTGMLVLTILVVRGVSRSIYRPLGNLVHEIHTFAGNDTDEHQNEIKYLEGAFRLLRSQKQDLQSIVTRNRSNLSEIFIQQLLTGQISDDEEFQQKRDAFSMPFTEPWYAVLAVTIDGYNAFAREFNAKEQDVLKYAIIEVAQGIIGRQYATAGSNVRDNQVVFIINTATGPESLDRFLQTAEAMSSEIQAAVLENSGLGVTITVSTVVEGYSNIKNAYREAETYLKKRFYRGLRQIITPANAADDQQMGIMSHDDLARELEQDNEKFANLIKSSDCEGLDLMVDRLLEHLVQVHEPDVERMKFIISSQVRHLINELEADSQASLNAGMAEPNVYREALDLETIQGIGEWMRKLFRDLASAFERSADRSDGYVSEIIAYIGDHYTETISLEDVAQHIGLNTSYVSTMFNREIGTSFPKYINLQRIGLAKKTIIENRHLTNKEIADIAGFYSVHNFIRIFKEHEGVTPGRFRDNVRSE